MLVADTAFLKLFKHVQVGSFSEVLQPLSPGSLHRVDALVVDVGLYDAVQPLVQAGRPRPGYSSHCLEEHPGGRRGHFLDPPAVAAAEQNSHRAQENSVLLDRFLQASLWSSGSSHRNDASRCHSLPHHVYRLIDLVQGEPVGDLLL